MLTNVLVPLDGSSLAETALPAAISLVRRKHGHVELVIVHEDVPYEWQGYEDGPWHSMNESTQVHYLHDKAEQLSGARDMTVGHALLRGDVADQICAHAAEVGADMIVMGTHGRTGLARALVGSVADAVVRRATIPVLLLRSSGGTSSARTLPLPFRRILVPIDDSPQSRLIFDAVAGVVERGVTELLLLRVVAPVPRVVDATFPYGYVSGPPDETTTSCIVSAADHELTGAAVDLAQRTCCDVDPHVVVAKHPAPAILGFAKQYGADLIAMATHGRGLLSQLVVGSVAAKVLRDAVVPLLVIRSTLEENIQ
jgi:nucleotide-binding universal stress UspA family protein